MTISRAFCPAHITGFFKAHLNSTDQPIQMGSMGAGFSIRHGVTTTVHTRPRSNGEPNYKISTSGFDIDKTDVSESVLAKFQEMDNYKDIFFDIRHNIAVPVGYGLGSSAAVALSLSFALDRVLDMRLTDTVIGHIAHNAEIDCSTGLGDVLAAYHGGFEVRTRPGAPGIGQVTKIDTDPILVVMICFAPISTSRFIRESLDKINGLGGRMVDNLLDTRDYNHFQLMSLKFANYVGVMTMRMKKLVDRLAANEINCGIALFGETVFSMIPRSKERHLLNILSEYKDCTIIRSELDDIGARVLN